MVVNEIETLRLVDEALSQIDEDARSRVIDWMYSKYKLTKPISVSSDANPIATRAAKTSGLKTKSVNSKKVKVVLKQVKDLDLYPKGKQSFTDFVGEKQPSNVIQKAVVAIYYMLMVLEVPKVSVEHIYTAFKAANWLMPADLKNTLHQAGSEGWLDSADANDLKVTSTGENLVEHQLPKTGRKGR
jgi:hypothetical protein